MSEETNTPAAAPEAAQPNIKQQVKEAVTEAMKDAPRPEPPPRQFKPGERLTCSQMADLNPQDFNNYLRSMRRY